MVLACFTILSAGHIQRSDLPVDDTGRNGIIYTGYYENEIEEQINQIRKYKNITFKFGRFIPNQKEHYDDVLGVYLASDNQYGKVIS